MSDSISYDVVCPNNHNVGVSFKKEEFEAALANDELVFHCNTCDTDWTPTKAQIAEARKLFAE